jgi:hypothetical protein
MAYGQISVSARVHQPIVFWENRALAHLRIRVHRLIDGNSANLQMVRQFPGIMALRLERAPDGSWRAVGFEKVQPSGQVKPL